MNSRTSQRVAVIGLGRFGMALARRLSQHGAEVIAIDRQHKLIEEICNDVAIAVRLDSSEEAALRSQEVERVDCVVVAIGENFEAALLTTAICKKNLKVPKVICRAQTTLHAEIFRQIGADEVIQPEQNAGEMPGSSANPRLRKTEGWLHNRRTAGPVSFRGPDTERTQSAVQVPRQPDCDPSHDRVGRHC